jgi:hypothetical protein
MLSFLNWLLLPDSEGCCPGPCCDKDCCKKQ